MVFEPPVAFCIYTLLRDGLHVLPFDQHPDGDGSLRDAGLDAVVWQDWLATVVGAHARLNEAAEIRDKEQVDHRAIVDLAGSFFSPWLLCRGPKAIGSRLEELWAEFEAADAQQSRQGTFEFRNET